MTGQPIDRPVTPARYAVRISHRRRDPLDYGFSQRSVSWLVDLAELPSLPPGLRWLCRFAGEDHLGDPRAGLHENVCGFLAEHGVTTPSRILMLANPRVLGYVFNPLSVFYCYDQQGRLAHTVAEVRNTYGGRHCYLLETDQAGQAETAKRFYVSPFYPVDGSYTMRMPEPGAQISVTVTLHRSGERPFTAVLTGDRQGGRSRLISALASPLATRAVMFGIRRHGIALYLKGLRTYPRTAGSENAAGRQERSSARSDAR
ncbi:MAG TPA: DUF1365 domain-containing protein [Jatrophihabitans sp.]|nr:DUF1365 domain-containing protein [Jatrophihabitans sp.]